MRQIDAMRFAGDRTWQWLTFGAVIVVMLCSVFNALAHDSWISRGGLKNAAGEWCCGEGDCFVIPSESVQVTAQGYQLFGVETVPFGEAQPSPDGAFWRCKRPDGSRRCFFAPPSGS
jgi:hypothetical protein